MRPAVAVLWVLGVSTGLVYAAPASEEGEALFPEDSSNAAKSGMQVALLDWLRQMTSMMSHTMGLDKMAHSPSPGTYSESTGSLVAGANSTAGSGGNGGGGAGGGGNGGGAGGGGNGGGAG
eukprot:scpid98515/ scgid18973/ 